MEYKLEDICDFYNGGAWSESEYAESGIPVVKVSNIKGNDIVFDNIDYISESSLKKYQKNILKTNDVVIATVGSHPSLESSAAGRSVIIPKKIDGHLLNQNAVCLRTKDNDILDQKYLGYLAETQTFKNFIQNRGGGAANQMRIPIGAIKSYKFKIPKEQKKIAKILSSYDDLIENNLKQIKLFEEKARLIYEEWFLRFRIDGQKLEIDETTGLPFGWNKKAITVFESFKQDKSKVKEFIGEKRYLATADVDKSFIVADGEIINWYNKPSRAQIAPSRNSVWFARMSHTYKVLCFTNEDKEFRESIVLSSGFAGFKSKNELCLPFLYCTINSNIFHELKDLYATGATQVSLNNESMKFIKMIEPDIDTIESFGKLVLPMLKNISILLKQNQLLKESRDILLPRLMTGMIDVETMGVEV
ncbi:MULTISPECIES: restriction endonuclease subunit S [Francisella]|uniref:restriction endonuclease subunit S n=1 Tax=Francisella TaxID=262 RepID=UPI0011B65898|nr:MULTISPECIES: restriction endonuclease subunit S [Francisella]